MAQELLYGVKVRTTLQFTHGEAMTQCVWCNLVAKASFGDVILDNLPESLPCKPFAAPIEKQSFLFLVK